MPALSDRLILLLLAALAMLSAYAAEPRWPTQQEIEGARATHPMPGVGEIAREPVRPLPRIAPQRPAIDVEGIARRYAENQQAFEGDSRAQPTLMIFVTLAMPEASLKRLATQAARSGATMVIRGLKNDSMKKTLAAVQRIIGKKPVAWQIDPPAFTRFGVHRAPTFVLMTPDSRALPTIASCSGACSPAASFVSVAGDVSLDYALEFIARTRPAFAREAQRYLKRLRG